jgi:hypothetical protein
MSSPQNWRGTSKTIAWRVRVGPAARGKIAVAENGALCLWAGVRAVPVTNEIGTQP